MSFRPDQPTCGAAIPVTGGRGALHWLLPGGQPNCLAQSRAMHSGRIKIVVAWRCLAVHPRAAVSPHRPSEPRPNFFELYRSNWSPVTESNRRPSPYHGDALPTELTGPSNLEFAP
jgi:hypothetical protein